MCGHPVIVLDDNERYVENKDEALALKYNPLYEKNQLNPRVRLCVLIVFGMAFVIRVIAFLAFHR